MTTPEELRVQGAEAILNVLFESLTQGYSLGRVVERFREIAAPTAPGLFARLQTAGGLSVNNALFDQYEAAGGK